MSEMAQPSPDRDPNPNPIHRPEEWVGPSRAVPAQYDTRHSFRGMLPWMLQAMSDHRQRQQALRESSPPVGPFEGLEIAESTNPGSMQMKADYERKVLERKVAYNGTVERTRRIELKDEVRVLAKALRESRDQGGLSGVMAVEGRATAHAAKVYLKALAKRVTSR